MCVKKNDKYVWREIYQEKGGVSRKWIYQPNDGYIAGNEIKFRLVFLDNSIFYDSIDFTREKQYFGKNSFGKGSKDNCEDIGKEAAHGPLVTPIVSIDEVVAPKTDTPPKAEEPLKDAKAQSKTPAPKAEPSEKNQCSDTAPDDKNIAAVSRKNLVSVIHLG